MSCCTKYSAVSQVAIDVKDEEGHLTLRPIQNDKSEKEIQIKVNLFFKLLDDIIQLNKKKRDYNQLLTEVCTILKDDRNIITYQHCRDNKLRSLLHFTKYNFNLPYDAKQAIVSTIIDNGYTVFSFSESNKESDNYHSYFFTAAKGDYDTLVQIVNYFEGRRLVSKLHDTREGDTILSFMVKFGKHTEEKFLDCFSYLVDQNIDFNRIDYFKDTISRVLHKEKCFLEKIGKNVDTIEAIENIINEKDAIQNAIPNERTNHYDEKHKLFRSLIEEDENQLKALLMEVIATDRSVIDCDDGENTLLQLAIIKNNIKIVEMLLEKGGNPNHTIENKEIPLILAARLNRERIFSEILKNKHTIVTESTFGKLIGSEIKPKLFNYLLEFKNLNVGYRYNGKTPLYYAIRRKNKNAIQALLQKGAKLEDNCASNINPKDLEEYLNSCIKFDGFEDDLEENDYKAFVIFDFFIQPPTFEEPEKGLEDSVSCQIYKSEIDNIQKIGSNKRLAHLLEHPLVYIFILLKWYSLKGYYYFFVVCKFAFYACIACIAYNNFTDLFTLLIVFFIQYFIVLFNILEFKCNYKQYTLHFILELVIFVLLGVVIILNLFVSGAETYIKEISAFIIIFTSLSILLTLGYHINLSKWMSMAKRVFRNFCILLAFFLFPILAFAVAFSLLLPYENVQSTNTTTPVENEDFTNIPRAVFRTFILLSGDIGDKKFSLFGGYVLFLFFCIGMAIILLNFWTGVAVSDIKEIEEQSIIVAFNNVIVFIDSTERIFNLFIYVLFKMILKKGTKLEICNKWSVPFLAKKLDLRRKKKKGRKYYYGIDLFINNEVKFKNDEYFKSLQLDSDVISKIKALCENKDENIPDTLKELAVRIEDLFKHVVTFDNRLKRLLENKTTNITQSTEDNISDSTEESNVSQKAECSKTNKSKFKKKGKK